MTTNDLKKKLDEIRASGKEPRMVRLSKADALTIGKTLVPFLQTWRGSTTDDIRSLFDVPQLVWGVPAVRWDGETVIETT